MKTKLHPLFQPSIFAASLVTLSLHVHADPVSAVASGAWTAGTTWSDGNPATADIAYSINGFTVTSPTDSNTVTFPGASIAVTRTGTAASILNISRVHNATEQVIATNLPPISLGDGTTLRFQSSGGSNRWNLSSASSIAVSGEVLFDNAGGNYSANINMAGPVTGSGRIEYRTANSSLSVTERTLTLNAADSTYAGNWLVVHANTGDDFGTIAAGAARSLGTGTVTLGTRARLRNNANLGFDGLAGITLNDAAASVFFNGRDWTSSGGVLTLNNGAANVGTAHLNVASASQSGGSINLTVGGSKDGKLILSGDANFTGGTINVGFAGNPVGKTFDLITYGGELTTAPTSFILDVGRLTAEINPGSGENDKVTLAVSGTTADLTWTGNESGFANNWDNNVALNFTNDGDPDRFRQFDRVTFGNTSGSTAPVLIGTLIPSAVTFNHSTNDYTLGGAGTISGTTGITKSGTGTLTINSTTASNFSGGLNITGGTVAINSAQNYTGNITITGAGSRLVQGNAAALGATGSRTITVTNGGQFDFNGFEPGTSRTHTYRISGDGGGNGALFNNAGASLGANAGIQNLELLGNATIGGSQRYDIARVGTTSGTITGNGHTLTKTGANQIHLRGDASNLSIVVNQGILGIEDSNLAVGGASGSVTVNSGAVLGIWGARTIATPLTLNGGATLRTLGGAASTWSGAITLGGNATIEGTGANITSLSGSIAETGGAHALTIRNTTTTAGTYTYNLSNTSMRTGATTLRGSVFRVSNAAALGSGAVTIEGNGTAGVVTRMDLDGVTIANDINLSSSAQTGFFGPVTAVNGLTSTVSGVMNVTSNVGNGGHFASSGAGSVLRITGTINTTGPIPNIRQGTVEMGTTGGNLTVLQHGEGTLRLVANNGIQSTVALRLGVSNASTLDLNGFNQSLAEMVRNGAAAATVTNTAATPSVLTINGNVSHTFGGTINNGTGGISLVKRGSSTFTLTGANTYSGDTTVEAGTLSMSNAFLANGSAVRVTTGAVLNLTHAAIDTVDRLFVDGVQQPSGTYDANNSSFITGTGSLFVSSGPPAGSAYDSWLIAAGLTPGAPNTAASESYDGSGVSNILQFALGGDILDPKNNGLQALFTKDAADDNNLVLTVAVRDGATFAGSPSPTATHDGITYTIQGGTDLNTWTTNVEEVTPQNGGGSLTAPTGYVLKSFRLVQDPVLGSKGFLRVQVVKP
jgi:autotransporter-associated beta strand protein